MSPKLRKRLLVALLFSLLGAWVLTQYLWSERAHALWARQALEVHRVVVVPLDDAPASLAVDAPAPDHPLDEGLPGELLTALDPRLDFVSSCLMTDDGSRAPIELSIVLDATGHRPGTLGGELADADLSDDDVRCLTDALAPVEWPTVDAPVQIRLELADGLWQTRREHARAQAARLVR